MQNLHEILLQKKIKEIRFKAIASIVCGFLGIIPYLGFLFALASWILFFILLYDLKISLLLQGLDFLAFLLAQVLFCDFRTSYSVTAGFILMGIIPF